jgi:hypothetical protein
MFIRNIITKYRSNLLIRSYSIIQKPLLTNINNNAIYNTIYKSKLYLSSTINNKVNYFDVDSLNGLYQCGDYNLIASQNQVHRKFTDVKTLGSDIGPTIGDNIWIRGRLSSIRVKGNACFLVIRSGSFYTIQVIYLYSYLIIIYINILNLLLRHVILKIKIIWKNLKIY